LKSGSESSGRTDVKGRGKMTVKAIVYTSNTGYTAEYARMLGEETGLNVYPLDEAVQKLPEKAEVIYLGWVMGSLIRGLDKARKRFAVQAACGVLMGTSGSQIAELRKLNRLPESLPLFSLQGGFDMARLKGVYRLMMKFMTKALIRNIESKSVRSDEDEKILGLLRNGGSCVCSENLSPLIEWYSGQK